MGQWFDGLPTIGMLPPEQAAKKLYEVGEDLRAESLERAKEIEAQTFALGKGWWPFQDQPWQYTAHTFGYLTPSLLGSDPQPVHPIESISADTNLCGARIKVTLDRLRIARYPGGGTHRVLLHFFIQNQLAQRTEAAHFNATFRVQEGQTAGVQGYPLIVGLGVGHEGITLKCRTINVCNDQDEAFLGFLESNVFKSGLQLITTAQPVLAPFSEMAFAIAKSIAIRHRNVSVQDFDLGLDFSRIPMRGRLAEGAYLAVQIPESDRVLWDWEEWAYLPTRGLVVKRDNPQQSIPYNYLVFGISRYEEPHWQ